MPRHRIPVVADQDPILLGRKCEERRIFGSSQAGALYIQHVDGWFAITQTLDDVDVDILVRQEAAVTRASSPSAAEPPQGAQTVQDSSRSTAELCHLPTEQFMEFAGRHNVPLHYGADDLEEDRQTLERLGL